MKKKLVGIGLCLVLLLSTSVVASAYWTDRKTVRYNPGLTYGINVGIPSCKKTNNANQAGYFGKYITSLNTPYTYMVRTNNSNYKLGESTKMKNNENARGDAWAGKGELCNVVIDSSWTQGTSCTMDYSFSPDNSN